MTEENWFEMFVEMLVIKTIEESPGLQDLMNLF